VSVERSTPERSGSQDCGHIKSVCVFCGSAPGRDPRFVEAARDTGALLARRGLVLVYGGGHVGMMGALADAALAAGGQVTGVIPRHLMRPEVAHLGLSELIVVESMHQRKQLMADRADCFLVLPGGYGTLDETFEMTTWLQLGLQRKPLALVNVAGYFDPLLRWVQQAVDCGFVHRGQAHLLRVAPTPEAALAQLEPGPWPPPQTPPEKPD
jgi:uncharacterized protein (TIGR00730 family)